MGYVDTTMKVIERIASNQLREQEEDNYPKNIAEEVGINRSTLNDRLSFLEDIGVAKKVRQGQKKIIRLNSVVIQSVRRN